MSYSHYQLWQALLCLSLCLVVRHLLMLWVILIKMAALRVYFCVEAREVISCEIMTTICRLSAYHRHQLLELTVGARFSLPSLLLPFPTLLTLPSSLPFPFPSLLFFPASKMTYTVSGGALNSTQSVLLFFPCPLPSLSSALLSIPLPSCLVLSLLLESS